MDRQRGQSRRGGRSARAWPTDDARRRARLVSPSGLASGGARPWLPGAAADPGPVRAAGAARAVAAPGVPGAPGLPALLGPSGARRVLVVEDGHTCTDLLTDVLRGEGYTITAADSVFGTAALARRLASDAILLDLELPYRSGAALLAQLHADHRTAHIPVLVIAAFPEALTAERRAMATAVLTKPLRPGALVEAVRAACAPVRSERRA
jgi:CheY-like chemotaxis protein